MGRPVCRAGAEVRSQAEPTDDREQARVRRVLSNGMGMSPAGLLCPESADLCAPSGVPALSGARCQGPVCFSIPPRCASTDGKRKRWTISEALQRHRNFELPSCRLSQIRYDNIAHVI